MDDGRRKSEKSRFDPLRKAPFRLDPIFRRKAEWLVTLPTFLWLTLFVAVPTLLVFVIAFRPANPYGGIGAGWTLDNVRALATPATLAIAWRTLWISLLTTAISLLLSIPAGYTIARASERWRNRLLMLVIVPFWTSFLVRVFAWRSLLHPEGPVKRVLEALGLVGPDATLLYNPAAVVLVMVYTFLPFTILPIYAAAEKFDFRLTEAARDLGARPFQAFRKVFLPGIRRGLLTAVLVVLIPSLGSYIIPDLVGGPGGEMLGNKIAQRVFTDRNLPLAAALSAVLVLAVLAPLAGVLVLQRKSKKADIIMGEAP
ncbi:MAG TPA: ABC transporter permease [Candidatus Aminicenantes bacterium]|nr:ABC transporter permease [Candidatus Aminicenantes bacterium]